MFYKGLRITSFNFLTGLSHDLLYVLTHLFFVSKEISFVLKF